MAKKSTSDLPGMTGKGVAPLHIKELDRLAERYCIARDRRLAESPKEVAAKSELLAAMHKHAEKLTQPDGILQYRYDERMIIVYPGKEKLKVTEVDGTHEIIE
jgi:hypothetical protein